METDSGDSESDSVATLSLSATLKYAPYRGSRVPRTGPKGLSAGATVEAKALPC